MFKQLDRLFAIILLAASIFGLIEPAISANQSISQSLWALFNPKWSPQFAMQWLLVLLVVSATYVVVLQFIYKTKPLTIISTKLTVTLDGLGGATLAKQQFIRANIAGVTAYFSQHTPHAPKGYVDLNTIDIDAYCRGWDGQDEKEIRQIGKSVEILHIFKTPLPYAFFMPLLPIWILNRSPNLLWRPIEKNIVRRSDRVTYINEFDEISPVMNFTQAGRYRHFNLCIEVDFTKVPFSKFKARQIRDNGVVDVQFEQAGPHIRRVRVDKMRIGTLRITWEQSLPNASSEPVSGDSVPSQSL